MDAADSTPDQFAPDSVAADSEMMEEVADSMAADSEEIVPESEEMIVAPESQQFVVPESQQFVAPESQQFISPESEELVFGPLHSFLSFGCVVELVLPRLDCPQHGLLKENNQGHVMFAYIHGMHGPVLIHTACMVQYLFTACCIFKIKRNTFMNCLHVAVMHSRHIVIIGRKTNIVTKRSYQLDFVCSRNQQHRTHLLVSSNQVL